MKRKLLLTIVAACACIGSACAQKGTIQLKASAEVAFPGFDSFQYLENVGAGASVKGMIGVNKNGFATVTAAYLAFPQQSNYGLFVGLLPVMAGYRHNFGSFYGEAQAGLTDYRIHSEYFVNSYKQLTWSAGVGYQVKQFDVCGRFQSGHTNFKTSSFFALQLGYIFKLSGRSASE